MSKEEIKADPLATIPTTDLISELMKRCDPAVFIGYKNEGTMMGVNTFYEWMGNPDVCYGLCHQLSLAIQTEKLAIMIKDNE